MKKVKNIDFENPNVNVMTAEEFEKTTLYQRKFRKGIKMDEKVFSNSVDEEKRPTKEELEEEVEEVFRNGFIVD